MNGERAADLRFQISNFKLNPAVKPQRTESPQSFSEVPGSRSSLCSRCARWLLEYLKFQISDFKSLAVGHWLLAMSFFLPLASFGQAPTATNANSPPNATAAAAQARQIEILRQQMEVDARLFQQRAALAQQLPAPAAPNANAAPDAAAARAIQQAMQ